MTIGNFSEVIGNEGDDNLIGSDLQILYGLAGDDILAPVGGSSPEALATTVLVGGSGGDLYQVSNNSIAIIIENGNNDNDIGRVSGINIPNIDEIDFPIDEMEREKLERLLEPLLLLQIDNNRHLYIGDTESNQYALLIDWQNPENRIENFSLEVDTFSYPEIVEYLASLQLFVQGGGNVPGFLGSLNWEEANEQTNIDLERLGLSPETIDEAIAQVKARSAELETGVPILEIEDLANPNLNQTFALDGVTEDGTVKPAFVASATPGDDLIPFYSLQSLDVPGTYLFVSTEEYNLIFADDSNQKDKWVKEGLDADNNDIPEFYLYGAGTNQGIDFHSFQNTQNNTFFYAGSEETAAINGDPNLSGTFLDQGVAFEA